MVCVVPVEIEEPFIDFNDYHDDAVGVLLSEAL